MLAAPEQYQAAEQTERDERLAELVTELAGTRNVSADTPPAPPGPESTSTRRSRTSLGQPAFTPYSPAEQAAMDQWWTEHHRVSALRDAAREQAERLQAEAFARELPTGRVRPTGLVRAPCGQARVKR